MRDQDRLLLPHARALHLLLTAQMMLRWQVVEEVASAQETVGLLLPQGDYTAALDVLDSLRASLASYRTAGLHAFRHLPAQLADIAEVGAVPMACRMVWQC